LEAGGSRFLLTLIPRAIGGEAMSRDEDGPGSFGKAAAKDAAIALAGTAAVALGAPAVIAAAAGGVLGVGIERVMNRDTRRAQRLFERLLEGDESPEEFAQHLRDRLLADDEAVISAFRSLLAASLDAVSESALESMAVLARRHFREPHIPVWLARGGLRVMAECTAQELAGLRQFVQALAEAPSNMRRIGVFVHDDQLEVIRSPESTPRLIGPVPPDRRRLFRLLKVHALADDATDAPPRIPNVDAIAIELVVVRELELALRS